MKPMTKAETIRHLKRSIKSMDYYLKNYIIPFEDDVKLIQKMAIGNKFPTASGMVWTDEQAFEMLIANLEDCLRTVKKLKVR